MKKNRLFALLCACALSASLLTACGGNTSSTSEDEATASGTTTSGTLKIGYTVYQPMNYTDENGNFTGFDTEFAEAVCDKLGVEPEFIEINWDTKVVELDAKTIDCIWNGMTISDDLRENMLISDPYVMNKQVVVIRSDKADQYTDVASLADASLVAEAGSAGQSVVEDPESGLNADNLTTVTKQTDALLEVASGASDAAVLDWTLAKNMIGEGTDFADLMMIDGLDLAEEEYGIGFRKDDTELCNQVNEAMKELVADGTLPALADKYGLSLAPSLEG